MIKHNNSIHPLAPLLSGFGDQLINNANQERKEDKIAGLITQSKQGDPESLAKLASLSPESARAIMGLLDGERNQNNLQLERDLKQSNLQQEREQQIEQELNVRAANTASTALNILESEGISSSRRFLIQAAKNEEDPNLKEDILDTINMQDDNFVFDLKSAVAQSGKLGFISENKGVDTLSSDQAESLGFRKGTVAQRDPQGNLKIIQQGDKPLQQASGKGLNGYVFDSNTGQYSIDPQLKSEMDKIQRRVDLKSGQITNKDKKDINDKITNLTSDVRKVASNASSLDALKGRGTSASKLAAVFQFMKSLDPTSVVRETEQGQVYAAQGAASQLAGSLNNLIGEGKLTEKGFEDIVDTAKTLANSAINSSEKEVRSYLDVFDNLDKTTLNKLNRRVPHPFDLKNKETQKFTSKNGIEFEVR